METPSVDKTSLFEGLRRQVASDLETLERRQRDTQAGAVHEENRSEHAKDTRSTEDSYLARGLAERVEHLRGIAARLAGLSPRRFGPQDAIGPTALVELRFEDATEPELWLIVPGAGGFELDGGGGGRKVRTVTPVAPLGRALLGLVVGDEATLRTPRGVRAFEVVSIG